MNDLAVAAIPLAEEPLENVAYIYDGSTEGLLTAVFMSYANHEDPQDVAKEGVLQPRLGQSLRYIDTDMDLALRVAKGVQRDCGDDAFSAVVHASLSDDPDAGTIVYRFIRFAMPPGSGKANKRAAGAKGRTGADEHTGISRQADALRSTSAHERADTSGHAGANGQAGSTGRTRQVRAIDQTTHPTVEPLLKLDRAVMNERHRLVQFLRFEHLENGAWFARCNPNASVVPLLMDWFSGRFNTQPFMIYDENHHLAGVYEGGDWYLVQTDSIELPAQAPEEELMQSAWKRFYDTVSIEARYNPELRRQYMPKRLWKNILEVQDLAPSEAIVRR